MRVTFNAVYRNGIDDINRAAERLSEWQRQVSSQKRIQLPSDDPSAMVGVIAERVETRALDQYTRSTNSVDSQLRVVDTLLSDMLSALTAAQTTAAAARSSVLEPAQRKALAGQMRGIRDTILLDVNGQYRGTFVFSGTASLTAPFTKDGSGVVQPYAGNSSVQRLDIDRTNAVEVTLDGGAVMGSLFSQMEALATAIETGDVAQIDAGFAALNEAFARVTAAQSGVGNVLGDIENQRMRLDAMRRASESRRSSLEDANLAEAISRMQQAETAYRAALSSLGSSGQLSLMDYLK